MPARQPTAAELGERLEPTYRLLAAGLRKSAIQRALRGRIGPLHHTTAERYLSCARIKLLTDLGGRGWTLLGIYRYLVCRPSTPKR
jgi:hypothetical protein